MSDNIAIKVEHLSKQYVLQRPTKDEQGNDAQTLWALKDVSFEIKQGESVGIIGHNGSGKSTLLKILAGVNKPTSGRVEINGRIASILDIGAGFHPELSGRENIFLNGQIHGFSYKAIEAKLDEIISFSGIETFIHEPVKNYSNGMYLRLAFSIMAHLDFDVYLLDEVLSVGDALFQQKVEDYFKTHLKDKTIVIISHEFMAMMKIADRFYGFKNGEVTPLHKSFEAFSKFIGSSKKIETENLSLCNATIIISESNLKFNFGDPVILKIRLKTSFSGRYEVVLRLFNEQGYLLSSDSLMFREQNNFSDLDQNSEYVYSITLPKFLLSLGNYYVKLLVNNGVDKLEESGNVMKITIVQNQSLTYNSYVEKIGSDMISIPYQWDIKKI
jgi:ABC-type polysaccharide/polyol phosphate transport system ATPase subunit